MSNDDIIKSPLPDLPGAPSRYPVDKVELQDYARNLIDSIMFGNRSFFADGGQIGIYGRISDVRAFGEALRLKANRSDDPEFVQKLGIQTKELADLMEEYVDSNYEKTSPSPFQDWFNENINSADVLHITPDALQLRLKADLEGTTCFLAGTRITLPDGSGKPIETIEVGDMVMSYDEAGNLIPRRVTETFQKEVDHVLDFHGLMVTPGHVTLCGDGEFAGQHVPIIDIIRTDGAVVKEDGSLIRAATNEPVGSRSDDFVIVEYSTTVEELKLGISHHGKMRLGTRLTRPDGTSISVLEAIEAQDGLAFDDESGMVRLNESEPHPMPFFGALPKPEDYVMMRSQLTLNDIYAANEWEDMGSLLQSPVGSSLTHQIW